MPQARAWVVMAVKRTLRWFSERSLESSRPSKNKRRGRMTTAAITGPAKGPRPASSSPAIRRNPHAQADVSKKSVGPILVSGDGNAKNWTASELFRLLPLRYSEVSELLVSSADGSSTAVEVSAFLALGVREKSRSEIFAALPFLSRR